MAADLHIHVMTHEVTERDIASFFSSTLGSKYFSVFGSDSSYEEDYEKISSTPNVWVGEVSWLKQAFLSADEGEFVPDIVAAISDIIDEDLPVCDDALINQVKAAYAKAAGHAFYSTAGNNEVVEFLEKHKGKHLFTVSW